MTLWDLASGRPIRSFEAGPDPVGPSPSAATAADSRRAAGRARSRGLGHRLGRGDRGRAWDPGPHGTGQVPGVPPGRLPGSPSPIMARAKVHLWDLAAGTRITHPGPMAVSCVEFTPDGKRLAALGYDGNVHLPTPGPATRCWCSAAPARPPAAAATRPGWPSAPTAPGSPPMPLSSRLNLWDLGPAAGLAVEPGAGDVAGWLRRSRALAERDDAADAEAAAARAREIRATIASPWIEHAAWLYRRGDSARARDALARAMEALPDDPARWVDLGRLLGRVGWTEGVGDGAGEGPVALSSGGSPTRPTTRRPPRPWPSCSRMPTNPRAGPSSSPR